MAVLELGVVPRCGRAARAPWGRRERARARHREGVRGRRGREARGAPVARRLSRLWLCVSVSRETRSLFACLESARTGSAAFVIRLRRLCRFLL